jgi:hypothetical protein
MRGMGQLLSSECDWPAVSLPALLLLPQELLGHKFQAESSQVTEWWLWMLSWIMRASLSALCYSALPVQYVMLCGGAA